MDGIIDIISAVLLISGALLSVVAAVGVLRFPEFYSRIHAAGVNDTLAAGLMTAGMVMTAGFSQVSLKLVVLLGFLWVSGPVASYLLASAARHDGIKLPVEPPP